MYVIVDKFYEVYDLDNSFNLGLKFPKKLETRRDWMDWPNQFGLRRMIRV